MGFGGMGGMELALIMLVLMLVFGAKRLPELGRGLGKGIREFKDSVGGITAEIESAQRQAVAPRPQAPPIAAGSSQGGATPGRTEEAAQ